MTDTQEMTNPPESRICHECGTEIPGGTEECPRCALEAELKAKGFEVDLEALAAELPQLEILEELGRGGMGVVYKASQKSLGRDAALKILPKELDYDPGFSERFLRESRTLAGLSHPHIVAVHDAGQAAGHHYLLMEFVDGTDLAKLMRVGKVKPEQALSIVSQVCDALQYAHDQGVVHRDIKPGNILLDRAGEVKLGDFGLAKLVRTEDSLRLTGTLQAMGTPQYMAPEQIEKPLEVDHRADLYSLGVVLYELLTGELPIGRFQVPSKKAAIDVKLDEVVLKTLEKEPELRYQSASEVRVEVDRASSREVERAAGGLSEPTQEGGQGGASARPEEEESESKGGVFRKALELDLGLGSDSSNKAVASLILGLLSIFSSCCCSPLNIVFAIPGVILGWQSRKGERSGMALAGLITSMIGLLLALLGLLHLLIGLASSL